MFSFHEMSKLVLTQINLTFFSWLHETNYIFFDICKYILFLKFAQLTKFKYSQVSIKRANSLNTYGMVLSRVSNKPAHTQDRPALSF